MAHSQRHLLLLQLLRLPTSPVKQVKLPFDLRQPFLTEGRRILGAPMLARFELSFNV